MRSHSLIGQRMIQLVGVSDPLYLYFLVGGWGGVLCLSGAQLGYRVKLWKDTNNGWGL